MADQLQSAVCNAVGVFLVSWFKRRFQESRDPFGCPWKPLKYRQGKPLLKTGAMRASITFRVEGDTVVVGTVDPKAQFHNNGTRRTPQRQFIAAAPEPLNGAERVAADVVERHLAQRA